MRSAGFLPGIENIIHISDYLDCSVDYLLGRNVPNPVTNTVDINTNHGVGQINAPVTIRTRTSSFQTGAGFAANIQCRRRYVSNRYYEIRS